MGLFALAIEAKILNTGIEKVKATGTSNIPMVLNEH
jgi:hypothetical protein